MHTHVTRDQFEVSADLVIHTPTGVEFIPGSKDSLLVWTGEIGRMLFNGAVYRYGEVLAMMKTVWRERDNELAIT
jgi:hypothetical protein